MLRGTVKILRRQPIDVSAITSTRQRKDKDKLIHFSLEAQATNILETANKISIGSLRVVLLRVLGLWPLRTRIGTVMCKKKIKNSLDPLPILKSTTVLTFILLLGFCKNSCIFCG